MYRFLDTCVQFVSGFRCPILISRDSLAVAAIICGVLYTRRLKVWSVSSFPGGACKPCPAHIAVGTEMSASFLRAVGWPWVQPGSTPGACRCCGALVFCNPIRSMKRPDTCASMSSRPQPPCLFGLCSVDIDTKNVAPFHMYHAMAVVNCRAQVVGTGNTWAVCQILARRYVCTYRIRCERCKSRPYVSLAWALTCLLLSPSSCSLTARWCL